MTFLWYWFELCDEPTEVTATL